jgi:ankyrin repeat protein
LFILKPFLIITTSRRHIDSQERYLKLRRRKTILFADTMNGAYGRLGLHEAAFVTESTPDVIKELLRASPSDARHSDENGHLPLHVAVLLPSKNITKSTRNDITKRSILHLLIGAYPKAVKMPDNDGNTPLHLAARQVHYTAIKVLLKADPDGAHRRNNAGCTPLHLLDCMETKMRMRSRSYFQTDWHLMQNFIDRHEFKYLSSKIFRDLANSKNQETKVFMLGDDHNQLPLHKICSNDRHHHPYEGEFVQKRDCHIKLALEAFPEAAAIKDTRGNFPLNHFVRSIEPTWTLRSIVCGARKHVSYWKTSIVRLAQAYPKALTHCDSESGLFPLTSIVKHLSRYKIETLDGLCRFLLKLGGLCPEALIMSNEGKNPIPFSAVFCFRDCYPQQGEKSRVEECENFLFSVQRAEFSPMGFDTNIKRKHKKTKVPPLQKLFWETLRHLPGYHTFYQHDTNNQLLPQHMMALCGDMFLNRDLSYLFDYFVRISRSKQGSLALLELDERGNMPLHLACAAQSREAAWWLDWHIRFVSFYEVSNTACQSDSMSDMFDTCLKGVAAILEVDTPCVVRETTTWGSFPYTLY